MKAHAQGHDGVANRRHKARQIQRRREQDADFSGLCGRDRDLIVLGLDQLLWSLLWVQGEPCCIAPEQLLLEDDERSELARLSLRYGADVIGERVDRDALPTLLFGAPSGSG